MTDWASMTQDQRKREVGIAPEEWDDTYISEDGTPYASRINPYTGEVVQTAEACYLECVEHAAHPQEPDPTIEERIVGIEDAITQLAYGGDT